MDSPLPQIVLFNAATSLGGTAVLALRMAGELKRLGAPFLVIDQHGGFLSEELRKLQLPCVSPASSGKRRKLDHLLPANAVIIAYCHDLLPISTVLDGKAARLLLWDVYPPLWLDGFLNVNLPVLRRLLNRPGWFAQARKDVVSKMMNSGGVVFTDEIGLKNVELLTGRKWPEAGIVPVPVEMLSSPQRLRPRTGGAVSCVYIGRASPWKVVPARRLLEDFGSHANVHWTILTESATRFKAMLGAGLTGSIDYVEGVYGAALDPWLLSHADICFGMGTSCLEGAKLGVPSILMDFVASKDEMPGRYGYRWLYQEAGYGLGRDVSGCPGVPGMTAGQVLAEVQQEAGRVGRLCWETVREKFALRSVAEKLLLAARHTRLGLTDCTSNNLFRLGRLGQRWRQFRTRRELSSA